eukprot:GDKI01036087.1.p1 GENE.GDKI01036087.1~~GDKI01036087.1.p1  ORF type:complete len:209 (+),score=11.81 GDKI01036087.1:73-627(+)
MLPTYGLVLEQIKSIHTHTHTVMSHTNNTCDCVCALVIPPHHVCCVPHLLAPPLVTLVPGIIDPRLSLFLRFLPQVLLVLRVVPQLHTPQTKQRSATILRYLFICRIQVTAWFAPLTGMLPHTPHVLASGFIFAATMAASGVPFLCIFPYREVACMCGCFIEHKQFESGVPLVCAGPNSTCSMH